MERLGGREKVQEWIDVEEGRQCRSGEMWRKKESGGVERWRKERMQEWMDEEEGEKCEWRNVKGSVRVERDGGREKM